MSFVRFETHFDILRSNNLRNSEEKDRDFNDVKRNSTEVLKEQIA